MYELLAAFAVSLGCTLLLVRHSKFAAHRFHDHDLSGPQKFHATPVPRVGGIGIFAGITAGMLVIWWRQPQFAGAAFLLLLCAMPAFGSGLTEDLTKTQSPRRRLAFTAISSALAVWWLDAVISRTDIPGLDWLVSFPLGAAAVTVFVVAGVANSLNIIDGFNGLASMCAVLMLASVGY
ncbi:MAG TPA: glycosyltransferase, partial [Piscinibacter sp.]|nr:glycosyltransferase [Piscinibacter sp.]